MNTMFSSALLILTFCLLSEAVQVQEGDFVVSLESVKKLQELTDSASMTGNQNHRLAKTSFGSVCTNPTLPQELMPLCLQQGGSMALSRLAAVPMDVCEICAFVACTGC